MRRVLVLSLTVACGSPTPEPEPGAEPDCAAPDASPAPTAAGHPTDGWRWERRGPLLSDDILYGGADIAYGDGALAPTLVDTGSGLHLLFLLQQSTGTTLWASTSPDATTWSAPTPVTGLEADGTSYPSLVHDDEGFRLWYGSGSIAWATSDDGIDFTPVETVLRAGDAAFDALSLLYPHALATETGVRLYYTGFDGAQYAIGEADCSPEATTCTGEGPILESDPDGWDNTSVGMPEVVEAGGETHFWYGGYDTVIASPGPWRIGKLVDGERLLSLPLTDSGDEAFSTRDPAVVPWGDGWLMVYVGMGDDGRYRLMSATSDVCSR